MGLVFQIVKEFLTQWLNELIHPPFCALLNWIKMKVSENLEHSGGIYKSWY
jgi:hypothetical protein